MMEFHSYCSYDGSPAGFVYGVTNIVSNEIETTETLSLNKGTNDFLKHCFESGLVRRVQGIIPRTKNNVLLLKNLKAYGEDGIRRYMNFALVYGDDEKKFLPKRISPSIADVLSQELAKVIIVNHHNEFGYQLNTRLLQTFIFEKLKATNHTDFSDQQSTENDVCYIGALHGTTVEQLSGDLGMNGDDFSLECNSVTETIFRSPAKKSKASSSSKMILLLATILLSIVVIALWILRRQ